MKKVFLTLALLLVNGVASSGTFVKASSITSWTTGHDGISSGWTVCDE